MALELTRPGKLIDATANKTSKFVAVNPNECIYAFHRKDYPIVEIVTSSGSAAIVVAGNITTELAADDGIYFTSEKYSDTEATIVSYSYSSGDDETTIVTNLDYAGVDDTSSDQYLNLIGGRSDYKINVTIYNGLTHAKIAEIPGRQPFKDGTLDFDLSGFLRAQLILEPAIDYSQVHSPNTNNSLPFYIKYQVSYNNSTETLQDDGLYLFKAVGAAQQIQSDYGANLGEFVSFNYNLQEVKKGGWMTGFEKPGYWAGYPFGLGFCYEDEGDKNINMKRVEERIDGNGTPVSLARTAMDLNDMNYANHVHLAGNYAADVKEINLWVETAFNVSYCGLLGIGSAFAFLKQAWVLDGSNNLLGIEVDKNSTLVDSIDTRPDGTLYNPAGVAQTTMQWDAVDSRYEPASGTHNISGAGWYVVINGIQVTMKAAYSNEVCGSQVFYQVYDAPNLAPVATNLSVSGTLTELETLTGSYTYLDAEGDLEDTGTTTQKWYSYTNALGAGETYLGTGATYVLTDSEAGKYIKYKVTPAALTGTSPGDEYASAIYGPVVGLETFSFTTDFNPATDGTFDPLIIYGGSDTPKWLFENASFLSGASISTTGNGLDGTTQTVKIKCNDISDISFIAMTDDPITGAFDVSTLDGLTTLQMIRTEVTSITFDSAQNFDEIDFGGNSDITTIDMTVPTLTNARVDLEGCSSRTGTLSFKAGGTVENIVIKSSGITALDVSNITFNAGGTNNNINADSASSFATFTPHATAGGPIKNFDADSTNLSSLDLSAYTIGGRIGLRSNSGLTSLTLGTQGEIGAIELTSCGLNQLDLGSFTAAPNDIWISNSSSLTDITMPSSSSNTQDVGIRANNCALSTITNLVNCSNLTSGNNWSIDVADNSMTAAEVNKILVDLDDISTSGYTGRSITIDGTNAAPDSSSGGLDGSAAVTSLVSKGFTVTTT